MTHETTGVQSLNRPRPRGETQPSSTAAVAHEVPWHRRYSPIGGTQRHYTLDPVLLTPDSVCADGVVVVIGTKAAYAFPADVDGHIADYRPAAQAAGVIHDAELLADLGYTTVPDTVWGVAP